MTSDDEQEMWKELLSSKGWAAIVLWARTEWSAQKERAITTAADDTADAVALGKLRQIIAADKAVQRLLNHPRERLEAMQHHQERGALPVSLSRGGA